MHYLQTGIIIYGRYVLQTVLDEYGIICKARDNDNVFQEEVVPSISKNFSYAIKETYYDSNGNTNSWNEYEYDENGNNIKEIYWVKDRKQGYRLCSETMKKYEKNQLIETEKNLYDKDGIIYENERQTNQYDEYGNVVENVIYKNGELFRSFKWQYIYNEFGLIETRSYYVDDMLSWVEKNEYSQK